MKYEPKARPSNAEPPSPDLVPVPVEFTGTASEYFRIWIVNLGLTLLTLGIYSAWAKVRTRQYLYGNLRIDGSAFEYTADPMKILIGRLIVGAGAAAYALTLHFARPFAIGIALLFFLASPWIAVRALSFNHRNTRWRNLRFAFRGSYRDAAGVYVGWTLLSGVSLGLLVPVAHHRRHAFLIDNSYYGAERFSFRQDSRSYYPPYLRAGLAVVLSFVGAIALGILLAALGGGDPKSAQRIAGFAGVAATLAGYSVAFVAIQAGTTNLLYGGASLAGHRFRSELRFSQLLWQYFSSALAIAASGGLLIPWAQIRLARYRVSRLTFLAKGSLTSFVAGAEDPDRLGAFADEAAIAFDFDFGL